MFICPVCRSGRIVQVIRSTRRAFARGAARDGSRTGRASGASNRDGAAAEPRARPWAGFTDCSQVDLTVITEERSTMQCESGEQVAARPGQVTELPCALEPAVRADVVGEHGAVRVAVQEGERGAQPGDREADLEPPRSARGGVEVGGGSLPAGSSPPVCWPGASWRGRTSPARRAVHRTRTARRRQPPETPTRPPWATVRARRCSPTGTRARCGRRPWPRCPAERSSEWRPTRPARPTKPTSASRTAASSR